MRSKKEYITKVFLAQEMHQDSLILPFKNFGEFPREGCTFSARGKPCNLNIAGKAENARYYVHNIFLLLFLLPWRKQDVFLGVRVQKKIRRVYCKDPTRFLNPIRKILLADSI